MYVWFLSCCFGLIASFKLLAARFLQKMCRSCPLFYRGKIITWQFLQMVNWLIHIILFCSTYSLSGSVITNEHTFSSHSVVEGHKCIVRHRYLPTDREAIPPGKLVCLTLVKHGSLIANFFINGVLKFWCVVWELRCFLYAVYSLLEIALQSRIP